MTLYLSTTAALRPTPATAVVAELIRIRGTVQGVGFRPTVYRLAQQLGLRGQVVNDGQGVRVRVAGPAHGLDQLVAELQRQAPPLARITAVERQPLALAAVPEADFTIGPSQATAVRTEMAPDAATCPQCVADMFNATSRYFHYPFTNCTHCGPRLSLIRKLPYDRQQTAMAAFPLCADCQAEYQDSQQRRFHAQPIACPACGPQLWIETGEGDRLPLAADAGAQIAALLLAGEILAIKGLGGVHLAGDATNSATVGRLRQAKGRDHKPFALMVRDLAVLAAYARVSPQEAALLTSPAAPIVVLNRQDTEADLPLAPDLAPGVASLGVMLPHTPLHHLIFRHLDRPMVMTSGNYTGQPQCIGNPETRQQLGSIASHLVLHNRDILHRVEDSLVRVVAGQVQVWRRARGYAPVPLALPPGFEAAPPLLALGGELKSAFCLLRSGQAILSQHLGDLERGAVYQAYQETLAWYLEVFQHQPQGLVIDRHPEYLSSKLGQEWGDRQGLPLTRVGHHHAHIAACLADNQVPLGSAPVLGIALDGLGYGEDDGLWGGEFLLVDYRHCRRLAHLKPVALLGGSQAMRQPWRNTYAQLLAALGSWSTLAAQFGDLELVAFLDQQPRPLLDAMLSQGLNAPLSSSAGRLFDAVAAALGCCRLASYEGQGAIALESLVRSADLEAALASAYPFRVLAGATAQDPLVLDPTPLWPALLGDLQRPTAPGLIAARFHQGLAMAIANLAADLAHRHRLTTVALSGGVWQNAILATQVPPLLTAQGLTVLTHRQVPTNDGGICLGQAVVAAARQMPLPSPGLAV
ncbi:MAG: carbamoyltransferase HypF [Cyanobacteriota bacterium]|nr:carbamoyltransferase HypF [Cyanobacteriota bacterium]